MELKQEWLENVLEEENALKKVVRLLDVTSEPAVGPGENFASDTERVQLTAELGSGKVTKMSLIVKSMPVDEKKSSFLDSHCFFSTEVKMYTEILPKLEEVLSEQGIPLLWPGFLGHKENILIFRDLKSKNYRTQCRKKRLDLTHAILTVRTLAIFHAGSVVLKERGLWNPSNLGHFFFARNTPTVKNLMIGGLKCLATVMAEEWGPEWSGIAERLKRKASFVFQEMLVLSEVDEKRLNVLCHGDVWTTNLLFKYSQGTDAPIGVRFIDFQLSHYNSYAYDLYYLLTCGLPVDLRRNFGTILESYVNTLRDNLTYYGYPELAPTLAEAEAEMSRLELFKFMFLISNLSVVSAHCKDPINFEAYFEPDGIVHNPEIYRGGYKEEVELELLTWAKEGLF